MSHDVALIARNLGASARGVLMDTWYESYCIGSDELVAKGIWDNDGQLTDEHDAPNRRGRTSMLLTTTATHH